MSERLKELVDQMPDADGRAVYTTNIDKAKIEKAIAEIYRGGRESVLQLLDMLGEPGSDEDVKPHYASHCLENYALIVKDEEARREFSETLAGELDGERPDHVKAFICQQLQWAGRREAAEALGRLLVNEALVEPAAMALVAIRAGAAEQFRAAVPKATGKCRLTVVQGLGAVSDTASVGALREALSDPDREVRLAAGWGLACIGDAASADLVVKAADVEAGWERIQSTKHCLVLAEKLAAAGKRADARRIYAYLRKSRTGSEAYVREAAERGLAALS